jgi:hypothetical protein
MLGVLCGGYALPSAGTRSSRGLRALFSQSPSGDPVASPILPVVEGTVDIAGTAGRFRYDFDHNALSDAVRVGDALVALAASGNLLRFETPSMTLTAQAVIRGRGTAIAKDASGAILLGTEDGGIFSVDSRTLIPTPLARVDGAVGWIYRDPARLIAAVLPHPHDWWPAESIESWERRSKSGPRPWVFVQSGARTMRYAIPRAMVPNALAVSGTTLWLGVDRGEFGGELIWLDLASGRSGSVPVENVLGLLPTSDGRLLAFGGLVHIVASRGFVAEVARTGAKPVWGSGPPAALVGPGPAGAETSGPDAPVDDLREDTADGGFWLLADHVLYHATADFTRWSTGAALDARFLGGRKLSAGNTPSIRRLLPGRASGDVIAVSALDGAWRVPSAGIGHTAFAGQIGRSIVDIWPLPDNTLFLSGSDAWTTPVSAWHVADGRWTETPLCPDDLSRKGYAIGNADGGVLAYCEGNRIPGRVGIARVEASAPAVIVDTWESSDPQAPGWFVGGPDGQLFGVSASSLWIRNGRSWRDVGTAAVSSAVLDGPFGRSFVPLAVGADGRVLQWAPDVGRIAMLARQPGDRWRLEEIHRSQFLHVLDATRDGANAALIATPSALFRYHVDSDRVERLPMIPRDSIVSIARDQEGRLWAAGDRLHVSRDNARRWTIVDLPMMSRTRLKRVRPNPAGKGVVISLYDRGMLWVE